MKFSLAEKIAFAIGGASLVAIFIVAVMVKRMSDVTDRSVEFTGQSVTSGKVTTKEIVDEGLDSWGDRHMASILKFKGGGFEE